MTRIVMLTLAVLGLMAGAVSAQGVVILHSPPPVVSYSSPAPVLVQPPVVVNSLPVVSYSAPSVVNPNSPVVTQAYYPGSTTVYTAYYPAATTVYAAPASAIPGAVTVYSGGPVVVPGVVTSRSYVGLGIFRPRGVYTESYFTPYVR